MLLGRAPTEVLDSGSKSKNGLCLCETLGEGVCKVWKENYLDDDKSDSRSEVIFVTGAEQEIRGERDRRTPTLFSLILN